MELDLAKEKWTFTEGNRERRGMSLIHKADDPEFLIGYAICEDRNEAARAEDIARGRLMAAAPELLAACEGAIRGETHWMTTIEAVIRKAKGKR